MPELPDLLVYLSSLESRILGRVLEQIRVASPSVLRSVDPPLSQAHGRTVVELRRLGKRIVIGLEGELFLVIHLTIAGRLRWQKAGAELARGQGHAARDTLGEWVERLRAEVGEGFPEKPTAFQEGMAVHPGGAREPPPGVRESRPPAAPPGPLDRHSPGGSESRGAAEDPMIDLYYWPTPNGWKVSIALEEMGLEYKMIPVNIGRGEQFEPDFLAISPNNRMPAIVDHDPAGGGPPLAIFESGAILLYLAERSGQFLPKALHTRYDVVQWLMWQMGGLGPMCGQNHHFRSYAPEKISYAIERYTNETNRLYGVLDKQLAGKAYICGEYSIADMACWPWIVLHERQAQSLEDTANLKRWFDTMKSRPAVIRGFEVGQQLRAAAGPDEEARKILFGQTARR